MNRNTASILIAGVVSVIVAVFYFLHVQNSNEQDPSAAEATKKEIDGEWIVSQNPAQKEADFNPFNYENQTEAGFKFMTKGSNEALAGRTANILGSILVEQNKIVKLEIRLNNSTIETHNSKSEQLYKTFLQVNKYEDSSFSLEAPIPIASNSDSNQVSIIGDLQLAGITKPVKGIAQAQLITPEQKILSEITDQDKAIQLVLDLKIDYKEFGLKQEEIDVLGLKDTGNIEALINFVQSE